MIVNRKYFLINKKKQYSLFFYTALFNNKKLVKISDDKNYDLNSISSSCVKLLDLQIKKSPLMLSFWKKASLEIKQAVLLSYWHNQVNNNKKIANVQISENWLSNPFFSEKLKEAKKEIKLASIFQGKNFLNNLITVSGKHQINLRFDNIHLCVDEVMNKKIFQVHWDKHNPKKGILSHFFGDDFIG